MEKNWNKGWGLDLEKKRKKLPGKTLTRLNGGGSSYAEGRDSVQGPSMFYAAGLQAGGYPPTEPKKETTENDPAMSAEQEISPYLTGKDQVKEPELPYGAGPQAWGYPQPQEADTTPTGPKVGTAVAPYLAGKDQVKEPELPYGAGPQAWGYPQPQEADTTPTGPKMGTVVAPYLAGKDQVKEPELPYGAGPQAGLKPQGPVEEKESGHWLKKKAPKRTSLEVRGELEPLEGERDDLLREAETWESQAMIQETLEEMSRWEEKGRELREKAAELDRRIETLQKEWEYAMNWEWEEEKREKGYRDPTLWDLTVGSFWQEYNTAQFGKESYRDMLGDEDNRKEEYEEKLAGEEYKFIPGKWWEDVLSGVSSWIGGEAYKALSPEALGPMVGAAGTAAIAGQMGPQITLPEEVVTIPATAMMAHKAGSIVANIESQAGLAYNALRENGVPEETARGFAMIIGGVNGAIDMIPMDSLIESVKILDASGVPKETIELFVNELEKAGVDIRPIIETLLKTEAQEGVFKAGVEIGTRLEGRTEPKKAKNAGIGKAEENPWISDHTARKLLENQSMLDYLAHWGDLKLTKSMKLEERIAAVKEATAAVIKKQKKAPFDREGKKRFKR